MPMKSRRSYLLHKNSRLAVVSGLFASILSAAAQDARSQQAPTTADDTAIELSPFTVTSEKDEGFVAASALAGGRLKMDLKDTPLSYSVMNRELIDALGITDLSSAIEWTTNTFRFPDGAGGGDTYNITVPVSVRGVSGVGNLRQRNFFIYFSPMDSYSVERYDFGRGPNQVLFGNGTVGGTQVSMTKRARFDRDAQNLEISYGSWNAYRTVLDVNQRLGRKAAVRLAGLYADRDGWRDNEGEKKRALFATFAYRLGKKTEVRLDSEIGDESRRTPYAILTDRFGGWDGKTVYSGKMTSVPSNSGALGVDRRGSNYFVYNPLSGSQDVVMDYTNDPITRGAGDTATTYAGNYLQVGSTSWNQSGASLLHANDVAPGRFDRATANSGFSLPGESFTNAPDTPTIVQKYRDLQLTLSHQVGDSLFLEVAGDVNRNRNLIDRFEADSPTTYIDINQVLPSGEKNPNFLRAYGDGRFWKVAKETDANSIRAAVAYVKDLGRWGNYSFNVMGGLTSQFIGTYNYSLQTTANYGSLADVRNWGNTAYAIRQRFYWGDSRHLTAPQQPLNLVTSTGAVATVTPKWIPAIADDSSNNVQEIDNRYNFALAAMNAKYFDGRVVLLGAVRYDDSSQHVKYLVRQGDFSNGWDGSTLAWRPDAPADWASLNYVPKGTSSSVPATTRIRTANAFGVREADPAYAGIRFMDDYNPPDIKSQKATPSTGAVVYVTRNISLYGNYAKATSFNSAGAPDVNGGLLPAVEGKGWDAGLRFSFFKSRLNISGSYYSNEENGNYVDPTSVTNQINTLYQANVYGDTATGGRNRHNLSDINGLVRDTRTRLSKGAEFEVTANLSRGWRLTANYALPTAYEKNYAPMTRAYVAAHADDFRQVLDDAGGTVGADGLAVRKSGVTDTGTGGSESLGNEAQRAANAYNAIYTNVGNFVVNQRRSTTSPKEIINVFSDYSFQSGRLKGFRLGFGFNERGKRVVGYRGGDSIVNPNNPTSAIDDPSVDGYTPVWAPGSITYTAVIGYTFKLKNKREIALSLRINNLLNNRSVIWTDTTSTLRPKGGDFTTPARETVLVPFSYQNPINFTLTANIRL